MRPNPNNDEFGFYGKIADDKLAEPNPKTGNTDDGHLDWLTEDSGDDDQENPIDAIFKDDPKYNDSMQQIRNAGDNNGETSSAAGGNVVSDTNANNSTSSNNDKGHNSNNQNSPTPQNKKNDHKNKDKGNSKSSKGQGKGSSSKEQDKRNSSNSDADKENGSNSDADKGNGSNSDADKGNGSNSDADKGNGSNAGADEGNGSNAGVDKGNGSKLDSDNKLSAGDNSDNKCEMPEQQNVPPEDKLYIVDAQIKDMELRAKIEETDSVAPVMSVIESGSSIFSLLGPMGMVLEGAFVGVTSMPYWGQMYAARNEHRSSAEIWFGSDAKMGEATSKGEACIEYCTEWATIKCGCASHFKDLMLDPVSKNARSLVYGPNKRVVATMYDTIPDVNIAQFTAPWVMCFNLLNPAVMALSVAKAAVTGTFTIVPWNCCLSFIPSPWFEGIVWRDCASNTTTSVVPSLEKCRGVYKRWIEVGEAQSFQKANVPIVTKNAQFKCFWLLGGYNIITTGRNDNPVPYNAITGLVGPSVLHCIRNLIGIALNFVPFGKMGKALGGGLKGVAKAAAIFSLADGALAGLIEGAESKAKGNDNYILNGLWAGGVTAVTDMLTLGLAGAAGGVAGGMLRSGVRQYLRNFAKNIVPTRISFKNFKLKIEGFHPNEAVMAEQLGQKGATKPTSSEGSTTKNKTSQSNKIKEGQNNIYEEKEINQGIDTSNEGSTNERTNTPPSNVIESEPTLTDPTSGGVVKRVKVNSKSASGGGAVKTKTMVKVQSESGQKVWLTFDNMTPEQIFAKVQELNESTGIKWTITETKVAGGEGGGKLEVGTEGGKRTNTQPESKGGEQPSTQPENKSGEQPSTQPENKSSEQPSTQPENKGSEQSNAQPENKGSEQPSPHPENKGGEQPSTESENLWDKYRDRNSDGSDKTASDLIKEYLDEERAAGRTL